jgi:hypothetical protein
MRPRCAAESGEFLPRLRGFRFSMRRPTSCCHSFTILDVRETNCGRRRPHSLTSLGCPAFHRGGLLISLRTMLIRAFLGEPVLLLLEEPAVGFRAALLNRVAGVRDRGGAVIWLIRSRMTRDADTFAATQWLRLTDHGLAAVRSAA